LSIHDTFLKYIIVENSWPVVCFSDWHWPILLPLISNWWGKKLKILIGTHLHWRAFKKRKRKGIRKRRGKKKDVSLDLA